MRFNSSYIRIYISICQKTNPACIIFCERSEFLQVFSFVCPLKDVISYARVVTSSLKRSTTVFIRLLSHRKSTRTFSPENIKKNFLCVILNIKIIRHRNNVLIQYLRLGSNTVYPEIDCVHINHNLVKERYLCHFSGRKSG